MQKWLFNTEMVIYLIWSEQDATWPIFPLSSHNDLQTYFQHGFFFSALSLFRFHLFPFPPETLDTQATSDVFPVAADPRAKSIQKQVKSTDVDKVGSKKPLASKSFFV